MGEDREEAALDAAADAVGALVREALPEGVGYTMMVFGRPDQDGEAWTRLLLNVDPRVALPVAIHVVNALRAQLRERGDLAPEPRYFALADPSGKIVGMSVNPEGLLREAPGLSAVELTEAGYDLLEDMDQGLHDGPRWRYVSDIPDPFRVGVA